MAKLAKRDRIKEELKFHTEVGRILSAVLVMTAGGTITHMAAGFESRAGIFLVATGLIVSCCLLLMIARKYIKIKNILNNGTGHHL